ncbi:MAG: hypothetical protein HWN65_04395 [Candidatus Helarchaeota archaeon]|nr:hypothetical protein [Candidatus Helarchaeota archaeon]
MVSNKFGELKEGDLIEGIDGPVNRQAILRYAETSGDRNPIHTTYEVAMAAGLKGVIQHGLFSMAWLIKTLTNWLGDEGKLKQINIQFRAMVRPNDMVYSKGKIIKKYKENGEKLVDLELIQEAWSLLCRGTARASDKSIDEETFQNLLSNAELGMEIKAKITNGEVNLVEKEKLELNVEGLEIIPNSLSYWEAFTRGWNRKGEKIQVKLTEPPENGQAKFEIYKVSNSIKGSAIALLKK